MNKAVLMPIVVLVWAGFLGCLGVYLATSMARSTMKRRMQEALTVRDEDVDDLAQDARAEEMGRSLVARVLTPVIHKLGASTKAKARGVKGEMIKEMLMQAGHPLGMGYAEFMGLKTFMLLLGVGIGVVTSFIAAPFILLNAGGPQAASDPAQVLMAAGIWVLIFAFIGFCGPTFWLRRTVNKRLKAIRKAMADVVDLIVLAIEAGLGFDMAVGQAVEKTKGPLTEELRRVLDEVRVGKPQGEAFRSLASRIKMQELTLLVAAIDQAMKMGVGLGQALRLQATEIREKRMAFIKEQAGKLPVKMMLPLVLFIFPALFVVILGPAAVQMMEMSASGQLPA